MSRVYVNVVSDTCINVTVHSTCMLISCWTWVTCFCVVSRKLVLFRIHIRYEATIDLIPTAIQNRRIWRRKPIVTKILSVQEQHHEMWSCHYIYQLACHHSIEHLWLYQRPAEILWWTTHETVKIQDLYQSVSGLSCPGTGSAAGC